MRLLILDQFSDMGGAQRCLADLIPALLNARWNIQVLLPGEGPLVEVLTRLQVPVRFVQCGPYSAGRKTLRDIVRFAGDYRAMIPAITDAVRSHRADLVYVNGPRLLPAAARACGRTPILFHSHSYLDMRYVVSFIGRELRRTHAGVIASSRFVATPWMRYMDPGRVTVIYNGVPEISFQPKPAPADRPWRIGVIGRIASEKGQLEFVRAAQQLTRTGLHAEYFIHGAPLWSAPDYLTAVRFAAGGLNIHFAGWSSPIGSVLHELDLLVAPSPAVESTTRVLLEAFSAGTPVIAFASGGIPEVMQHGRNGFLARAVTPDALAATVRRVVMDPDVLPRITACARLDWEERYQVNRYCSEVMEAMEAEARRISRGNDKAASSTAAAAVPSTGP
jgi:glycosyltransferase involved in cell wall biosynthesis